MEIQKENADGGTTLAYGGKKDFDPGVYTDEQWRVLAYMHQEPLLDLLKSLPDQKVIFESRIDGSQIAIEAGHGLAAAMFAIAATCVGSMRANEILGSLPEGSVDRMMSIATQRAEETVRVVKALIGEH